MTSLPSHIDQGTTGAVYNLVRDPNDKKNRAPSEVELKGLRALMTSNLHVAQVLDEEVTRLQSTYKALSDRLRRQQLEVEATQSELFETRSLIDSLQVQRSSLQKRMHNLNTLMHPVRRLPAEIIKYIFESTVGVAELKIQEAIKLSAICHSWREIALDTPRLWCTIETMALPDSQNLWPQWIRLIRSLPAEVCINDIENGDLAVLQEWQLHQIVDLKALSLNFSYPATIQKICKGIFKTPYSPLRILSVSVTGDSQAQLDLDILLQHFPSLSSLSLRGGTQIQLYQGTSSSLVVLMLRGMFQVDFHAILRHLPQLETIEITSSFFEIPTGPSQVTATSVRRLKFRNTRIFDLEWVMDLHFPRLTSLFNGSVSTPLFLEFVKSHPSIRELDCINEDDQLISQASSLPRLTYLSVTAGFDAIIDWRQSGLPEAPFPSLRVLMFGDHKDGPEVPEFEGVVRARCLPKNHPKSLLEHESLLLGELRVLIATRKWESEVWALHELAQEASREIIPYKESDGWDCVVLRWNRKEYPES